MWKEPIVEEIHLVREKIAKECNYDLKKIVNRQHRPSLISQDVT